MSAATSADAFVGRWHADDGYHTVIVVRGPKCLRVLVQGHPVTLRRLPLAESRHITPLDYPLRRAARKMRAFARNNGAGCVRSLLDGLLA